jgi:hypothetical protein
MTTNNTDTNDSHTDDSHAHVKYRHGTGSGKSHTLHDLTEQIAVSPVGWTCFDPNDDDAIAFLDLRATDEALGGEE